jgi:hypothetical protein
VYVYLGGPQFDAVVDDTLESAGAFGMSLAGLGDVTGDGRADLAIGSLYEPNPGQVYVVSFSSDVGSPPPGPVVDALHLSVRGNPARGEVHLALALDRDAPVTLTRVLPAGPKPRGPPARCRRASIWRGCPWATAARSRDACGWAPDPSSSLRCCVRARSARVRACLRVRNDPKRRS